VAQARGAERLLVSPAKTASAGAALALAVAALLLPGCGSGSSDPQDTAATSTGAAAQGDSPGSQGPSGSTGSQEQGKGGSEGKGDSASTAGQPSGGGKHGPRIAQPKGPREKTPTAAEAANATVADMVLQSPAITASAEGPGRLPATYTCDGADSWPELHWGAVPPGTAELILYAMNLQPVEGRLFVDWALAGIDPALSEIGAGRLPAGTVVGTNSFGKQGYSICPPAGSGEVYVFALYALPTALSPKQGFDPRELRERILAVSGNVGLLPTTYSRG